MRNSKNDRIKQNKLDASHDSYKYNYQKKYEKAKKNNNNTSQYLYSTNKKINNNNNCINFQNKNRNKTNLNINKKHNITNEETYIGKNNNKINLLRMQNTPNRITKNKMLKYSNTPARRDCHTPDKNLNNLKCNIGLSTYKKDNIHNISLLKTNNTFNQRNNSFIEYHFKNSSKKFIKRSKSKNNNPINDRKKAITPDKSNKTRNIKFSNNYINLNKYIDNKKNKEPIKKHNYNYDKSKISIKFANSLNNNYSYTNSRIMDNNDILNNSSFSNHMLKETWKRKTPDKYSKNMHYNNSKLNSKKTKTDNSHMLTNISRDKFSKSFYSQDNSNDRKNLSFLGKNDSYLFSNLKYNQMKKDLNKFYKQNYYSKAIMRSKSTDANYVKNNLSNDKYLFNKNNNLVNIKHNSKNKNNNNNLINNVSYEKLSNTYFNNDMNFNQLTNPNNYLNHFNISQNIGNFNLTQKNTNVNKTNNPVINKKNVNTKTFIEMAQQQINNKKITSQKNNKLMGTNNFITKSSTNTYDDINSSHSIISKNNQIMDSIEEIHFNFVNVVQTSRNIMKNQENIEGGERIICNNPNSTVIIVEERDIE